MFRKIRNQIFQFSKRPQLAAGLETERIKNDWEGIVGSLNREVAGKSQPLYVNKDNELIVRVKDHIWLQEMYLYRDFIEKKISARNKTIKSVRFVI